MRRNARDAGDGDRDCGWYRASACAARQAMVDAASGAGSGSGSGSRRGKGGVARRGYGKGAEGFRAAILITFVPARRIRSQAMMVR